MDDLHREQTRIIEKDVNRLADRFDRHLEIYAANKKELSDLKNCVTQLQTNQSWMMRSYWALMTPILGGIAYLVIDKLIS